MNSMCSRIGEVDEGLGVIFDSPVGWVIWIGIIQEVHQLLVVWKEWNLLKIKMLSHCCRKGKRCCFSHQHWRRSFHGRFDVDGLHRVYLIIDNKNTNAYISR